MTPITRERAGGRQITAELGVGLVLGFMLVAFMLSFASLLFNGAPQFVGAGAGLFLVGAAVHNLGSARWSAGAGAIVVPQDAPTAIVAAALASLLPAVEAAQRAGTILVYTAVCTLAAGVVMVALGAARLGRLARYIPTPVIGGFLAGTGWLLVSGGAELVTAGYRLDALHVAALAATVALAVALLLILRFKPSVLVVPAMVAAGTLLFFAVLAVTGTSLEQARSLDLLPSTPAAALRLPFMEMATADLSMLSSGLGGIISVPLVSTMALLLNVSALDLLRGEDGDLDGELRNVGFTNLITATVGLPAGYHAIGPTALAYRLGVVSWSVPLVVAVVALAAAFAGSVLVGLVPIPVISGLLIFLGLGFMTDWLIDRRRRMSVSEFAVMLTIVAIVATLGLLAAVAWGMVAAVVLFVVAYSRIDPIRYVGTARERRSTVDREAAAADFLDEEGDAILVIELHGYLFFGTSHALIDRIQGMLAHPRRTLILDLHRVQGADSRACSLTRVAP